MAKIVDHVTSVKGDNARGPLLYNPDSNVAVTLDTDFSGEGWKKLGYGSTDGVSVETAADDNEKSVWGLSLGKIYSNFTDTITLHVASLLDPDLWSVIAGTANVTTDAATGVTTVKRSLNITKGTFVIVGKTDAGKTVMWIYRGQVDPNISYDASESDVVTFDLAINAIADENGVTSTMLMETDSPKA